MDLQAAGRRPSRGETAAAAVGPGERGDLDGDRTPDPPRRRRTDLRVFRLSADSVRDDAVNRDEEG